MVVEKEVIVIAPKNVTVDAKNDTVVEPVVEKTANKTKKIEKPVKIVEEPIIEPDSSPSEDDRYKPNVFESVGRAVTYQKGSMLNSTFKVVRREVYDNYFMNDDTIALVNEDDLYLDTGTNPLRLRPRSKIVEDEDFWITPTIEADGPGE